MLRMMRIRLILMSQSDEEDSKSTQSDEGDEESTQNWNNNDDASNRCNIW